MNISLFQKDYISNYKPKDSPDLFAQEFLNKKFLVYLTNEETCQELNKKNIFYSNIKVGIFFASLLPIIFSKRISMFRNLPQQKFWKRFLIKSSIFLLPNYTAFVISDIMTYRYVYSKYHDFGDNWGKYKVSGDILDFNSDLKIIN